LVFGGIVSIGSILDSGIVACDAVRRAMACPVGPSGSQGKLKGLLGWVIVGLVLWNTGSRHAVTLKSSVVGIGVVGF